MVFITSYISGERKTIVIHSKNDSSCTCQDIYETLQNKEGSCNCVYLTSNGRPVQPNNIFKGDVNVVATLQLKGGKGGFGSMLRAIGAQIEKTTNREACRDLSGRRLRDINEEKRLKDFLAKKVETEKERLEVKRKKLQQLKEGPKHTFEDKAYFEQREKREKDIYDSLDKAFACGKDFEDQTFKPSVSEKSKKVKGRMLDDLDESSEEDSSDEDDDNTPKENEDKSTPSSSGASSSSSSSPTPSDNVNKNGEKIEIDEDDDNTPKGNEDKSIPSSSGASSSSSSPTPSDNVNKNGEKREIESDSEKEHADKKLKTN